MSRLALIPQRPLAARAIVLIAAAAIGAARPAGSQQLVGLARGQGEIGGQLDGERYVYPEPASTTGSDYRTWILIPLEGTLLSPGVLAYRLVLSPTWLWQTRSAFPDAQRARQLNLSVSASALAAHPVSLRIGASRVGGSADGGFGSRRDFTASVRTVALRIRLPGLPVELSQETQSTDETWTNLADGAPLRVASTYRATRIAASNSKLALQIQRAAYDDRLRDADHVAWTGNAHHTFRWGKGSRLESSFGFADQQGALAYRRRDWAERLHLAHSHPVRTAHFYRRSWVASGGTGVRTEAFGSSAEARLGRWANATVAWSRHAAWRDGVRDRVDLLAPRLGATLRLPLGLHLSASGGLGIEWRRPGAADELVPVVEEPHQVPVSRGFALDQPNPDPASVVVRSADALTTYVEGPDYELVPTGRSLTLRVPPGSRIEIGSSVLVSYRYRPPRTLPSDAIRGEYAVSLTRRGLSIRHRRHVRDTHGPDARESLLFTTPDFDDQQTTLTLQLPAPVGRLTIDASLRARKRFGERTTDRELATSYTPPALADAELTLGSGWTQTRTDGHEAQGLTLRGDLAWTPLRQLRLQARLEALRWSQTDAPVQRALSGGLGVDWRFGAVEFSTRYDRHRLAYLTDRTTHRFSARVVRRF